MELDFSQEIDEDFELGADDSLLSEVYLAGGEVEQSDNGLFWKEILREGEWAYRPGPGQKPVPVPLKVISGKSESNQEIGMADLIEAFNDGAIEHVTVPTSHDDKPQENTGYVKELKIIEKGGKTYLSAGIDFTEPDIKDKVARKSIANTSAGIIFDYVKKDSGKKYRMALGHVALTNKPWINGMTPFTEKFSDKQITLFLANLPQVEDNNEDCPPDKPHAVVDQDGNVVACHADKKAAKRHAANLAHDQASQMEMSEEIDFIALNADQIEFIDELHLRDFTAQRRKELAKKGHALPDGSFPIENEQDLRNAIQAFGRAKNKAAAKRHIIKRARALGKTNLLPESWRVNLSEDNDKSHKGGKGMASEEGKTAEETNQDGNSSNDPAPDTVLSEEQREALKAELSEEFKTTQAEKDAENEKLRTKVHVMEVEKRVNELKEEGYSEYPGLLKTVREILLADTSGAETLSLSETDDKGETTEVKLSVTGAIERVIATLPKEDGKVILGEQATSSEDINRPDVKVNEELPVEERSAEFAEDLGLPGFEKPKSKDGDA